MMTQVTALQSYRQKKAKGLETTLEERAAHALHCQERRKKDPLKVRYTNNKSSAKRRGIEFYLTEAEYRLLAEMYPVCPLTGVQLDFSSVGANNFNTIAALDRIDNGGVYSFENCWFISAAANVSKGNLTLEQMKTILAEAVSRGIV